MIPEMEYRFLGASGLQVSAISLGGWITYGGHLDDDFTSISVLTYEEQAFACLNAAYQAGINFFDCAESYSDGESERVIGRAIKHLGWRRNDIVISTKINWGAANSDFHKTHPARANINNTGLSRKHILEGCAASLQRLQLDYVDIIYAHRPDRHTPMHEVVRAFNHLIDTGKALYWGTSEWLASEIEAACAVAEKLGLVAPVVEQPGYSLLRREKVDGEFANAGLYSRHGLGLTIFSPLAGGLLTGKYVDGIPPDSRLSTSAADPVVQRISSKIGSAEWETQQGQVRALMGVAERLGTNVATLAVAWVLCNEHVCSAITGASRPEQIWETVHAIKVYRELSKEVLEEIEGIVGNKPEAVTRRFV